MRIVRALMPNEIPIDWLTHKLSQMKHIKRKVNFNFSKLMAGEYINMYIESIYTYVHINFYPSIIQVNPCNIKALQA